MCHSKNPITHTHKKSERFIHMHTNTRTNTCRYTHEHTYHNLIGPQHTFPYAATLLLSFVVLSCIWPLNHALDSHIWNPCTRTLACPLVFLQAYYAAFGNKCRVFIQSQISLSQVALKTQPVPLCTKRGNFLPLAQSRTGTDLNSTARDWILTVHAHAVFIQSPFTCH
jgi:hypothetical protein